MLGKQALQCLAMLSIAKQYLVIFLIYKDLCCAETDTFLERDDLVHSYTQWYSISIRRTWFLSYNLLLSKRAPPYPLYRRHRRPPPETPPKIAIAITTTLKTTSLTRTEGFVSLAAFDDPLGPSSCRYLRTLQRSKRKSRRDCAEAKAKASKNAMRWRRTHYNW
jgi:hypothetical protein